MSKIAIQRDPSGITQPEVHEVAGQVNLLDWLCDNLEHDMAGLHCAIYLNDSPLCNTWDFDPEKCNELLDIEIGEFDTVSLISRPAAELSAAAIYAIVAIVAAVAVIVLTPKPRLPTSLDDTGANSNNQLNGASNGYGLRKAIPDVAGKIVSYPLFAQRPYFYYENNRRIWEEYFYIGIGQYETGIPKESDTPFDTIDGYEYEFFAPGTHPGQLDAVKINQSTQDVDLLSSGQQTRTIYVDSGLVIDTGFIGLTESEMDDLELLPGDQVQLSLSCLTNEPAPFIIDGTYTVDTVDTDSFTVLLPDWGEIGTIQSGTISNLEFVFSAPWHVIGEAEEVWFSLKMPQGIRKGDGTDSTVAATLTVEELDSNGDPTGVTYSRGASFFGNTQTPQYQTFRMNSSDGLPASATYRARAVRITPSLGDNSADLLVLEYIAAKKTYTTNFGNITLLKTLRRSTQRVNQGQSSKVNVEVTRKLRIYDNDTGIYGVTYEPTRRFCDYAFYLLHELMGVPIAEINTDELFGITDNLSDEQLGYFDFTFDDRNVSARDRLETICNAARVRHWNEGLTWSFVRNEAKPVKTVMFNRRNLKAASAKYVQKFHLPSDNDGIDLKYVDPDDNTEKTISKRIVAGLIENGQGLNPVEMTLAGCRNLLQAQNRSELEIRQLLLQRVNVTDTALNDAQLIRLGERCDWVDIYDSDIFDGEILSVSGNVYTTSERFTPQDGVTYYVYVTDADGYPSNSVIATPRSDGNVFGFEAVGLAGVFLANGSIQLGSRYFIASNNDLDASTFTLIGRSSPNEKGECQIELVEYNPLVFEED